MPLVARGQRLGTLAVGRHQRHRHDAGRDRRRSRTWPAGPRWPSTTPASTTSGAQVAHTLQQSLLPPALPRGRGHRVRRRVRADRRRGRGGRRLLRRRPAARRPLAGGGRRRVGQGRAGRDRHRAGPRRDPDAGATTAGRCPRRCSRLNETLVERGGGRLLHAGAGRRSARRAGRRLRRLRCTWPATTGRCWCAPTGRTSFVGDGRHGAGPARRRSPRRTAEVHAAARATRWSSTPTG